MSFVLTIADIPRPLHRATSFRLSWRLGGRGAFSFSTFSLDGSYEPELGQDVKLKMDGNDVWAGNIQRIKTTAMYGNSDAGTPSISACEAVSYEARLDKRIIPTAVYLNQTCKEIITDCLWVKLADNESPPATELVGDLDQVADGVTIDKYVIDHARFSDVLDDLAARSGYCWFVDPTQTLYFVPRDSSPVLSPAPFSISDADPNCREVSVERSLDGYRNQQYIRISYSAFSAEVQEFVGDAAGSPLAGTQEWTLQSGSPAVDSPVNYLESVSISTGSPPSAETAKTFGVHGVDTGRDFYYAPGEPTIWQDLEATPLDPTQTLRVKWRALGADVMSVVNAPAMVARKVVEAGGTGVYDHLIDDSSQVDAVAELAKAQSILDAKSEIPVEVSGITDEPGLRPGQVLSVALSVPSAAASVLIDTVEAEPLAGVALRYSFHGSTAAYDDWVAVWNQMLSTGPNGISATAGDVPAPADSDVALPGILTYTPALHERDVFTIEDCAVAETDQTVLQNLYCALVYVDELTMDVFVTLDDPIDDTTDPVTVSVTANPNRTTPETSPIGPEDFAAGDWVLIDDPGAYECVQLTAIDGDSWTLTRHYPGADPGEATFESLMAAHAAGVKLRKLHVRLFTVPVRGGGWDDPAGGIATRFDFRIPCVTVAAVVASVWNSAGFGPWTVYNCAALGYPWPGLRVFVAERHTFGIEVSVVGDQTDWLRVRRAGRFSYSITSAVEGGSSPVYLDFQKSVDEGSTWRSIYPAGDGNQITLPTGSSGPVWVDTFADTTGPDGSADNEVKIGDLLRQIVLEGSAQTAEGLNTVLEWN